MLIIKIVLYEHIVRSKIYRTPATPCFAPMWSFLIISLDHHIK